MGPPPRGGLSLYDNLTDPNDPAASSSSSGPGATISSAPVLYNQNDGTPIDPGSKKPVDPALRFQPIRRPQPKQAHKTAKPPSAPKPAATPTQVPSQTANAPSAPPTKTSLADWAAAEEDEWRYGTGEKRQRGGRRRKKKKQDEHVETDWNELYDPARPTNIEEYLASDEKVDEVREWKALLYRHRIRPDDSDLSDDEGGRPPLPNEFAPPPSFNAFAPPPPSPPRAAAPPDHESGNDAYAQRVALSEAQRAPPPPPTPPPPPPADSATISRAPVRYSQPPEPDEEADPDDDRPPALGTAAQEPAPGSTRPGQAGFAARLMSKYGWTKGAGLGADESGMVNPLRVKVDKRKRRADADGGGWAEPSGKAKIIGGAAGVGDAGKFGRMSEVIVLRNMLEGMPDLQDEISNGLGQEIGEECGEKYGRVERLYIDQENRQVFIKFTDQVSALRAVNELEGRVFNGNSIAPSFYDAERFDRGLYY